MEEQSNMRWIEASIIFFSILLCLFTAEYLDVILISDTWRQKCINNYNIDTIIMDTLDKSIEGVRENFEPILNPQQIQKNFYQLLELSYMDRIVPEIGFLFFLEKDGFYIYSSENGGVWYEKELWLDDAPITRTDQIRKQLEIQVNQLKEVIRSGKQYIISVPYIANEEWVQDLRDTSLWTFYQSPSRNWLEQRYFYTGYSGSRLQRKTK